MDLMTNLCIVSSELPTGWFAAGADVASKAKSFDLSVLGGQDGRDFRKEFVPSRLGISSEVIRKVDSQSH
ncbi:hypothetical protein, partial [Saccharospirillum mangrovi]|uniref:hypothetical protein n=1 Tax=Saccharospirillum mangrovi TaxID=2161747 RepID=UPI001E552A04